MEKTLLLLILMTGISSSYDGLGLGIIVGEPTGISMKAWTGNRTAVDGAVAWSLKNGDVLHLHANYLLHNFSLIEVTEGKLPFYYGIGGRILLEHDPRIGIRIPVGLSYLFEKSPLDLFIEVVPLLDLLPKTEIDFNGAVGLRYIF